MSEAKDPLLKNMMMDSKQFIHDPAFKNILMNKIMKQDRKRFIMKRAILYCIPVLFIVMLFVLFSGPVARTISSMTIGLTADKVLQFFGSVSDYLHLFIVLLIVLVLQRWMSVRMRG